jgi:acetyltransferase-like isoleucine patch superfamily enzyme
MRRVRGLAREARGRWQTLRFRLWAFGLDLRLRRNGSRLILEAPHGAQFSSLPYVEISLLGGEERAAGHRPSVTLRLGRDVKLGRGLTLDIWAGGENVLELGDRTTFQSWCRVQLHDGRIAIDEDVQIRDYVLMKSKGELTLGAWSILSRDVIVHATEHIAIADRVGVAERSTIVDSEHVHDGTSEFFLRNPVRTAPIVIESNVLIHANVMVLAGSTVRRNVMVAAGALLRPGEYESGWLYLGVPARPFRELGAATTGPEPAATDGPGGSDASPQAEPSLGADSAPGSGASRAGAA